MQQKHNGEATEWDHLFDKLDDVERNPFKRKASFQKIKRDIAQQEASSNRFYKLKRRALTLSVASIVLVGSIYVWQNAGSLQSMLSSGEKQPEQIMFDYLTKSEVPYVKLAEGMFTLDRDFPEMHRRKAEYAASLHGQIVVDPHAYDYEAFQRGEVVYYQYPDPVLADIGSVAAEESSDTTSISRIVALPGETIEIYGGQIYINGKRLESFYGLAFKDAEVYPNPALERLYRQTQLDRRVIAATDGTVLELTVPAGHLFLLNDNWSYGLDSRHFEAVPFSSILGKVLGYHEQNLGKASKDELQRYLEMQPDVYAITWSPDEQTVAYVVGDVHSWEGQMHLWHLGQDTPVAVDLDHRITDFYWSPDSTHVLVDIGTSATRFGEVINRQTGARIASFMYMSSAIWSPDSKKIVYGDINESVQFSVDLELMGTVDVKILNLETGQEEVIYQGTPDDYFVPTEWSLFENGHEVIMVMNVSVVGRESYHMATLYPASVYQDPKTVLEIWSEGIKKRQGKLQFAALDPEVQKQVGSYYAEYGWSTGTSSPWIDQMDIVDPVSEKDRLIYTINYYYRTSTGPAGEGVVKVTLDQKDGKWYISDVKAPREPYYLNLPITN